VRREALLCRLANLACVYGVGGNTFFFDEFLYLFDSSANASARKGQLQLTMSNVFFALSLTNGRAMTGIRSLAEMWPFWLLFRSSYGTDMMFATVCVKYKGKTDQ
jgi:hypothetical protein